LNKTFPLSFPIPHQNPACALRLPHTCQFPLSWSHVQRDRT
jgi:hypothetical protein